MISNNALPPPPLPFSPNTDGVDVFCWDQSWEETVTRSPEFAQKWLQELVLQREDLAMIALKLNAVRREQGLNSYGPGDAEDVQEDDDDDYDYFDAEL